MIRSQLEAEVLVRSTYEALCTFINTGYPPSSVEVVLRWESEDGCMAYDSRNLRWEAGLASSPSCWVADGSGIDGTDIPVDSVVTVAECMVAKLDKVAKTKHRERAHSALKGVMQGLKEDGVGPDTIKEVLEEILEKVIVGARY